MARIVLQRDDTGRLDGMNVADRRSYEKFRECLSHMPVGGTLAFSYSLPHSTVMHRTHFALMGRLFDSQRQFIEPEDLRRWVDAAVGHCVLVPLPLDAAEGRLVALPRSINYERLNEAEFAVHHRAIVAFLGTPEAARFLWPKLPEHAARIAAASVLSGFSAEAEHGDTTPAG